MTKDHLSADHLSARVEATSMRRKRYAWTCEIHGLSPHSIYTAKCLYCYDSIGIPRSRSRDAPTPPPGRHRGNADPVRVEARRREHKTYLKNCVLHGEVAHSVERGRCLRCYNSLGRPRPKSTNPDGYYVTPDGDIREAPEGNPIARSY